MIDDETGHVSSQLRALGYPDAHWLAAGMEADVYVLDEQTVGRLPRDARAIGAGPVNQLLEELARCDLPFAVPAPLGRISLPDGRSVLRQPRLRGRNIGDFYDSATGHLDHRAGDALVELLGALQTIPHQRLVVVPDLPLLGETTGTPPTYEQPWTAALRLMLGQRTQRFGSLLRAHVDRFDDLARACDDFLSTRENVAVALQHGDICPPNVLVDDDCRLSAVLDWGFFTMLADPVFEMALTSSFFDMYGPHALRVDRHLSDLFAGAFGVQREDILRYKAAYALIGSNAYSDTADGHFRWCAAVLQRPDVRAAVLR